MWTPRATAFMKPQVLGFLILGFLILGFLGLSHFSTLALSDEPKPCAVQFAAIRNPVIDQNDTQFVSCNWLHEGKPSQLCGITSLANWVNSLLQGEQRSLTPTELSQKIISVGQAYLKREEKKNPRASIMGMFTNDLGVLTSRAFKEWNLPYRVTVKDPLLAGHEITPQSLRSERGALWTLSYVSPKEEANLTNHFVWVLSYDSKTGEIRFSDPLNPKIIKYGTVTYPRPFKDGDAIRIDLAPGTDMKELIKDAPGYFNLMGIIGAQRKG